MNSNALVIHENKCTSSIFIFMLRFGVDFLWISGSKWTVRLSLCFRTERLAGLPFPPGTARRLCFTSGDLERISGGFFFPSTQQRINSDMFVSSDHRSAVLCQALMKQSRCLRLDSLILSKEGRPVSQLSAGKGSTPQVADSSSEIKTMSRFLPWDTWFSPPCTELPCEGPHSIEKIQRFDCSSICF